MSRKNHIQMNGMLLQTKSFRFKGKAENKDSGMVL